MIAYLDERRAYDRLIELRDVAATERLLRSGASTMAERLAHSLRSWAARLDEMNNGFGQPTTVPEEDLRRAVPTLR